MTQSFGAVRMEGLAPLKQTHNTRKRKIQGIKQRVWDYFGKIIVSIEVKSFWGGCFLFIPSKHLSWGHRGWWRQWWTGSRSAGWRYGCSAGWTQNLAPYCSNRLPIPEPGARSTRDGFSAEHKHTQISMSIPTPYSRPYPHMNKRTNPMKPMHKILMAL